MLEGLNGVRWADYEHAYGLADDVPKTLAQLLDSDPFVRNEAIRRKLSELISRDPSPSE